MNRQTYCFSYLSIVANKKKLLPNCQTRDEGIFRFSAFCLKKNYSTKTYHKVHGIKKFTLTSQKPLSLKTFSCYGLTKEMGIKEWG